MSTQRPSLLVPQDISRALLASTQHLPKVCDPDLDDTTNNTNDNTHLHPSSHRGVDYYPPPPPPSPVGLKSSFWSVEKSA